MSDPAWLEVARKDIGLREIPGAPTEPRIAAWLKRLGAWWSDDATPWCGVACAAWMQAAGVPLPQHWYRAKGWLDWGRPLFLPRFGCVVVYGREGGGHVGIVVGRDAAGNIMTLGGNQGDAVCIRAFDPGRVLGYRQPPGTTVCFDPLPLLSSNGQLSRDEA